MDGGVRHVRFRSTRYPGDAPNSETRKIVLKACIDALFVKCSSTETNESAVKAMLQTKRTDFLSSSASEAQKGAVPFLPHTYKEALTILSKNGCNWPFLYRYDMCPCGFLYRGPHRDAIQCPAALPGRVFGAEPKICRRERTASLSFILNPIVGFIERLFQNADVSSELASWQERRSADPDIMYDIIDSEVVQDALMSDARFRDEPRNLMLLIATDDFIVSAQRAD